MATLGDGTQITTVEDKEIVLTSVDGQYFRMKVADLAEAVRQIMPIVTSDNKGLMSKELLNSALLFNGDIKREQINKRLQHGTYYHSEFLVPGESIYGILFVLTAADLQCQVDITLGGRIFFRVSHGEAENPTWDTEWTSIM